MNNTTVFRNENKISTEEVLKIFNKTLKEDYIIEKSEIEQLTDIAAKNPVDKFFIAEKPDCPVMQGDLLIWAEGTEEFERNYPLVTDLQETTKMALQEDDSITGDHELVPLKNSKFTLKKGKFVPPILKEHLWGSNAYDCKVLEIDSPFVIKHREHGNFTFLMGGKYMICSSLDSETLTRMRD